MKAVASSVTVTVKLLSTPSFWIAVVASGMLAWRKAAVLEKTSASNWSPAAPATAALAARREVHGTALPAGASAFLAVGVEVADEVADEVAGAGSAAFAAGTDSPRAAPMGNATIKAMVEPSRARDRLVSRVMMVFITIPFVGDGMRSIGSGAGPRAFGPWSC